MNDYAMRALLTIPIGLNMSDHSFQQGIQGIEGLTRTVNGSHIEYSYPFREFSGNESSPSKNMILRSSSNCTLKDIEGSKITEYLVEEDQEISGGKVIGDIGTAPSFKSYGAFLYGDLCANYSLLCLSRSPSTWNSEHQCNIRAHIWTTREEQDRRRGIFVGS